jgi:hypothetical protein
MKKISMLLLFVCLLSPLHARTLGYGLGYYALSVEDTESASGSGAELSLVYEPFLWKAMNPSLVLSATAGKTFADEFAIPSVGIGVSVDLFRTLHHPFRFVEHNPIAWDPSVSASLQWSPQRDKSLITFAASPFKLSQKDFWYEFLSPFVSYDLHEGTVDSWGFDVIRYTYFFK